MNHPDIFQYYKQTQEDSLPVFFRGPLVHDVLYNLAECLLEQVKDSEKIKNKVLSAFIELAQNIKLYSAERLVVDNEDKDVGVGVMTFQVTTNGYLVCAGNLVKNEEVKSMNDKIAYINSLDRDNLNKYLREERNRSLDDGLDGGNTGLIELVKRSNNPIRMETTIMNQQFTFITLEVTINKS